MKGSPFLRAVLLFTALLALSLPLKRVTQPETAGSSSPAETAHAAEPHPTTDQKLPLALSFSRKAERIELRHLGKVVWVKDHPGLRETIELLLPFPQEGIEMGVAVQWSGEELSALRLQLTTPDGTELDRTAWGSETIETVLSFP